MADMYESYRWNYGVETGTDSRTGRGFTLANFGMSVGSGFPRVNYIGGRWRVRLLCVELLDMPGKPTEYWSDELEAALRGYIGLIKGRLVDTPRGSYYAPGDLVLN